MGFEILVRRPYHCDKVTPNRGEAQDNFIMQIAPCDSPWSFPAGKEVTIVGEFVQLRPFRPLLTQVNIKGLKNHFVGKMISVWNRGEFDITEFELARFTPSCPTLMGKKLTTKDYAFPAPSPLSSFPLQSAFHPLSHPRASSSPHPFLPAVWQCCA